MRPAKRPKPLPDSPAPWRLLAAALLALVLGLSGPAVQGQDEAPADEEATESEELLPEEGLPDIDAILRSDEEIWSGGGYSYDPGDRRDPFKSLLDPRELEERDGPRPEGVPGLLIDDLALSGIFRTRRGWIAQVQATNQDKAHLIKEGDQLFDGDVVAINKNEVIFKQVVQDPTALKPFREVVKTLNP